MVNISVPFPDELRARAEAAAVQHGLSLDEFVRQCVSLRIDRERAADPLFADRQVFSGDVPSDLAENHDRYLYEGDA